MAPFTVNGSPTESGDAWIQEVHNDYVGLAFKTTKTLFSQRSPYQQVDIVDTEGHGRMLVHDGVIMFSERDEFDCRYYSADIHQAAFALPPFVISALGHLLDPSPFPMAIQGGSQ